MTGKEIIQLREAFGMSRAEFARALGVTPQTVWYWENGPYSPSRYDLIVLSRMKEALTDRKKKIAVQQALRRAQFLPPDHESIKNKQLEDMLKAGLITLGLVVLLDALFGGKN